MWEIRLACINILIHVHILMSHFFEKKRRLIIVDYITLSPVYQVKCKLDVFELIECDHYRHAFMY